MEEAAPVSTPSPPSGDGSIEHEVSLIDAARRREGLDVVAWVAVALLVCVVALRLVDGHPEHVIVPGILIVVLAGVWALSRSGKPDEAFVVLLAALCMGLLARPMQSGDAAFNMMYAGSVAILLIPLAPARLRAITAGVLFGLVLATYAVTADATTPQPTMADVLINGALVSLSTIALGFAALRVTRDAVGRAYRARTDAQRSARELDVARTGLEDKCAAATAELERVLSESRGLVARLAELSLTDYLTGLRNRRFVVDELPRLIAGAQRSGTTLTVGLLDLRGFKAINDEVGHDRGDEVLQAVARVMAAAVDPPAVVARLGGDEFLVILPGASPVEAQTVIDRLQRLLEAAPLRGTEGRGIGANVGIAALEGLEPTPGRDPKRVGEDLLAAAGAALNEAKRDSGGGR